MPYEAFDASDGPFLICVGNDRLFEKFASVLQRPDWPRDARFKGNRDRLANKVEMLAQIRAVLITKPRLDWLVALEAAGVPCAPINTIPEVLQEPQVRALGILQAVPGEDFELTGLPMSFDGQRPMIRSGAPRLGSGNLEDDHASF